MYIAEAPIAPISSYNGKPWEVTLSITQVCGGVCVYIYIYSLRFVTNESKRGIKDTGIQTEPRIS